MEVNGDFFNNGSCMLKYFQNILFNHKLQNLFKSPDYPANVYLFKVKDEITNCLKLRNHNRWKKNFMSVSNESIFEFTPSRQLHVQS